MAENERTKCTLEFDFLLEIHRLFFLFLLSRCFFTTNEHCMEWFRRLAKAVSPPKSTEELFAFAFYAWASEEGCNDLNGRLGRDLSVPGSHFRNEVSTFFLLLAIFKGAVYVHFIGIWNYV